MAVTTLDRGPIGTPWLAFLFTLPAQRASQRVKVWRQLQKYGALPWKKSAYLLPYTHANLEKFQWLAAEIRKYRGDASVLKVARIEGASDKEIMSLFNAARVRDYEQVIRDIRLTLKTAAGRSKAQLGAAFTRLNLRLSEIAALDAFGCYKRKEADELLKEFEDWTRADPARGGGTQRTLSQYRGRVWMTRPRPGIDRVSSAWLIRNFIDSKARFAFSSDARARDGVLRFDMFEGEFTHVGDDCTFETLLKHFKLRDKRLRRIAEMVHDADLHDNKYGRPEGKTLDWILVGWGKTDWPDEVILRKGFELFDALYLTLES